VHETVTNQDTGAGEDRLVAIFLHDNYARPHKKSGAWMSNFRIQCKNIASSTPYPGLPIVVNNNNFNRGDSDATTLLSIDDVKTLFHEFGHGLHGMLSNVTYQRLAGTQVLRDFVELPSQLYEHWSLERVVLKKYARHYQTNEPIPDELLTKLLNARCFGQGFQTVEYTSSALFDTEIHKLSENVEDLDICEFEKKILAKLDMPHGIVMRHRPAHFQHLFSGSSYAAAYYVYLWAEVLDADAFGAFAETGDCFNAEVAKNARKFIYSSGNTINPADAFRQFRGRDPDIEAMLRKKGLMK